MTKTKPENVDSTVHGIWRAKSIYYYNPIKKALKYYATKQGLTKEDLINKYGEDVFTNKEKTIQVRDELKVINDKEKEEKSLRLQAENYKKYVTWIESRALSDELQSVIENEIIHLD